MHNSAPKEDNHTEVALLEKKALLLLFHLNVLIHTLIFYFGNLVILYSLLIKKHDCYKKNTLITEAIHFSFI